jgi:hypothetical protein
MKNWKVYYRSRYTKEINIKKLKSKSKSEIRNLWHDIMETDEFVITKIEEIKEEEIK